MSTRRLWAVALLWVAVGCRSGGDFTGLSIERKGGSSDARIDLSRARMPSAGMLVFEARPRLDREGVEFDPSVLSFSVEDRTIATVLDTIEADTWVLRGRQAGTTTMAVVYEGERVETIDVEVYAP